MRVGGDEEQTFTNKCFVVLETVFPKEMERKNFSFLSVVGCLFLMMFVGRCFCSIGNYFVMFCLQTVLQDERQSQALMLKVSHFHLYFLVKRSGN